jgi:UPF0716 family protein affecting phage T7 exclusion
MMQILFTLIAIPLIEITLFIVVGGAIGILATMLWTVLSVLLGVMLLRRAGTLMARTAPRGRIERPTLSGPQLLDPILLGFGGVLMMLPGFGTDAIGVILAIDPIRALLMWSGFAGAGTLAYGQWAGAWTERTMRFVGRMRTADPSEPTHGSAVDAGDANNDRGPGPAS